MNVTTCVQGASSLITCRVIVRPLQMFKDVWTLMRGLSCLGAGGAALLGGYLSGGLHTLLQARAAMVTLVPAFVVASSNVVNDIRDGTADLVDKPERPIPAGRVSRFRAYTLATLCGLVALGCAAPLGIMAMALAAGTLIVGWLYSYYLKDTVLVGNAVIGLLDGFCISYGGLFTDGMTSRVAVASILLFLFCFAYLVLLTVRDHAADLAAQLRTVATVLGMRRAIRVFQLLAAVTAFALVVPALAGWFSLWYLVAIVATAVLPTATAAVQINRQPAANAIATAVLLMRVAWFPGLAALALAR
jgi:4-hydroxybenzoate polyprenyltransferase